VLIGYKIEKSFRNSLSCIYQHLKNLSYDRYNIGLISGFTTVAKLHLYAHPFICAKWLFDYLIEYGLKITQPQSSKGYVFRGLIIDKRVIANSHVSWNRPSRNVSIIYNINASPASGIAI